jgi:hypothetical protein
VVWYLEHVVSTEGVTTDTEKLKTVQGWLPPRDKHKLRSFPGLCTYYRRFIVGFADISKMMTQLMKEKWTFQWSPKAETPFLSLKVSQCTVPILGYLWPGEKFVSMETSNVRNGRVL